MFNGVLNKVYFWKKFQINSFVTAVKHYILAAS